MSIEVLPCASFSLENCDLPYNNNTSTMYSSVGYASNFATTTAWTRINLRDILGDAYDRYELFNLVLSNVGSIYGVGGGATAYGATGEDQKLMIYMSGLNWINQGYDSALKSNTNNVLIGNFYFTKNSVWDTRGQICPSPCTFSKSDQTTDLIITLKRNSDGATPDTSTSSRPWMLYYNFDIYGIEDDNLAHDSDPNKQSNSFLNI